LSKAFKYHADPKLKKFKEQTLIIKGWAKAATEAF